MDNYLFDDISPKHMMKFNLKNWTGYKEIQNFLMKANYRKIGEGHYASVWESNSDNRIVKIAIKEDLAWIEVAKWVMKQPPSKHLPKIFSFREYESDDMKYFIATMEKLEPFKKYHWKFNTLQDIGLYCLLTEEIYNHEISFTELITNDVIKPILDKHPETKDLDTFDREQLLFKLAQQHEFIQLLRKLYNNVRKNPHMNYVELDLSEDNIMYRPSTDSLVITDPIMAL